MMSKAVVAAAEEITALKSCCPVMQKAWEARKNIIEHERLNQFCASACPRGEQIPEKCPEIKGPRLMVCIVWRQGAITPSGGCKLNCPCMQPADDEWYAAFEKWEEKMAKEHTRRMTPVFAETIYDPSVRLL